MTFRPTYEQFKDFPSMIAYIESQGAHKAGLAKIIPPKEWCPRRGGYDDLDLMIPAPISQMVTGCQGLYQQYNITKKPLHVKEFEKLALSDKYKPPFHRDREELERKYWKNITFNQPIYGADISGSLYDPDQNIWNINRLGSILDCIDDEYQVKIEGVNTAYLYFGMWKTTFPWHTEDMDLYSINYVHFGAPKSWYAIPPEHGRRLERLAKGFFPSSAKACPSFLRHKMTMISPTILKQYSIPYDKITQEAGEFMITFPYGYHAGYNNGYNCAESTNFAMPRWIEYGKRCLQCNCSKDMVRISMDCFVKKFQPEKYELWKVGKDVAPHPEDDQAKLSGASKAKEKKGPKLRRLKAHTQGTVTTKRHPPARSFGAEPPEGSMEDSDIAAAPPHIMHDVKTDDDMSEPPELKVELRSPSEPEQEDADDMPVLQSEAEFSADQTKSKINHLKGSVAKDTAPCAETYESTQKVKISIQHASDHQAKGGVSLLPTTQSTEANGRNLQPNSPLDLTTQARQTPSSSGLACVTPRPIASVVTSQLQQLQQQQQLAAHQKVQQQILQRQKQLLQRPQQETHQASVKKVVNVPNPRIVNVHNVSRIAHSPKPQIVNLWPMDFSEEKKHNLRCAREAPHCCICQLFKSPLALDVDSVNEDSSIEGSTSTSIPMQSEPMIPQLVFDYRIVDSEKVNNSFDDDTETKPSRLLNCSECGICVHACCYGVPTSEVGEKWVCARCSAQAEKADCCLCVLRGGALKPTDRGEWAHVVCALNIPDVKFSDQLRSVIVTSNINPVRLKLKCVYCQEITKDSEKVGICTQCSTGKCATAFHVTCAHAAGIQFRTSDWPNPIHLTCTKHIAVKKSMKHHLSLPPICEGDTVIAKHKNGRYYNCKVQDVRQQLFCEVDFEDGSYSNNMFPEDIESHDITSSHAPPSKGTAIQVRWSDGNIYPGTFEGTNTVDMYSVIFEDGSELNLKREDVWSLAEELPKKIQVRLSKATEQKHSLEEAPVVNQSSVRSRKLPPKFSSDKDFVLMKLKAS
ncbi:hypothetical protein CAPTEDRAFT_153956 [Capitella teleta]|uniref:[histone H3]-trimethyl-L-lysine(9) demethylase n=1 Tax=Capitella teleta TaxID=283909 RepID=R7U206_CAPTE|nr:hypothetical protein CAPTEDRAFT_153956 [Capitella teleta]|eukprot:ELT97210.1 hypothetical protein CAPTEDRAFT_153956 [Capitella teleta]